jgi:hypothetical protein
MEFSCSARPDWDTSQSRNRPELADVRGMRAANCATTTRNETADRAMYTPENHAQMYEILGALRAYAGANTMPALAECLDDALLILAEEGREALARPAPPQVTHDGR